MSLHHIWVMNDVRRITQTSDAWPEYTASSPCPRCNEVGLYRDSVDVGVGIIHGPYGCPCCGWSENEEYDLQKGGGLQEDGGYLDPYGGYWPKDNPVVKMMGESVMGLPRLTYTYEVENDGERYEFQSTFTSDTETGRGWVAEDAAEDFYDNHDGWDTSWPLEFSIYHFDEFLGCFRVVMEAQPHFYSRKVSA